ncbi:MAG: hypothetical protein U0441_04815 [Polyangiaceae bacterium]
MPEVNPYAPSRYDEAPAAPQRSAKRADRADIEAAQRALDEHLADPKKVAIDDREWGGRVRTVTIAMLGLSVVALAVGWLMPHDAIGFWPIALYVAAACLFLIGAASMGADLSLAPRGPGAEPAAVVRSYLRSLPMGRYGYAWTCLAPTARAQLVDAPHLGAVASGVGSFSMSAPDGLKRYSGTFMRGGGGHVRSMQVKDVTLVSLERDVAVVRARLVFQSWPLWANIVLGVGVATAVRLGEVGTSGLNQPLRLFGLVGAVGGLIGLYLLRKKHTVHVHRTLLRGRNGAWYLHDPNVLEGATP